MYIKIQTSEKSNGNKGSAAALAHYLEKEDLDKEQKSIQKGELPEPRKGFFSHTENGLLKSEVISKIDSNKKGLGKEDAKFYSITISPSQKEQKHLLKNLNGKDINSIEDLSRKDLKDYENGLKEYSRGIMNEYASHFKRNGLNNGDQLLYFGKIEHQRNFKGIDDPVKNGAAKSGQAKGGLQSHIHIIVARKDKEMKWKLSPLATEKGHSNNSKLNGKKIQRGFDRNLFNIKAERLFDEKFKYARNIKEKVEYRIEASKQKGNQIDKKSDLEILRSYNERNKYRESDKDLSQSNKKERGYQLEI